MVEKYEGGPPIRRDGITPMGSLGGEIWENMAGAIGHTMAHKAPRSVNPIKCGVTRRGASQRPSQRLTMCPSVYAGAICLIFPMVSLWVYPYI